jgi:hypothetical protein
MKGLYSLLPPTFITSSDDLLTYIKRQFVDEKISLGNTNG